MQPFPTTRKYFCYVEEKKSNYFSTLGAKQYKPDVLNCVLVKIFFPTFDF